MSASPPTSGPSTAMSNLPDITLNPRAVPFVMCCDLDNLRVFNGIRQPGLPPPIITRFVGHCIGYNLLVNYNFDPRAPNANLVVEVRRFVEPKRTGNALFNNQYTQMLVPGCTRPTVLPPLHWDAIRPRYKRDDDFVEMFCHKHPTHVYLVWAWNRRQNHAQVMIPDAIDHNPKDYFQFCSECESVMYALVPPFICNDCYGRPDQREENTRQLNAVPVHLLARMERYRLSSAAIAGWLRETGRNHEDLNQLWYWEELIYCVLSHWPSHGWGIPPPRP